MESSAEFLDLKVSAILGTVWYREKNWLFLTKEFIYYVSCSLCFVLCVFLCFCCMFLFVFVVVCFVFCLCVCVSFHAFEIGKKNPMLDLKSAFRVWTTRDRGNCDSGFSSILQGWNMTRPFVVLSPSRQCRGVVGKGWDASGFFTGCLPSSFFRNNGATGFPWWYWFTAWRSWYQP